MIRPAAPRARRSIRGASLAACATLALAGCAQDRLSPGLETTILPAMIEYVCDDGRQMRVERSAGATSATASLGGNRWTLPRVESAAQEKYAQGSTALYLEGDIAFIESDGRVLGGNCRSAVALPKAPTMRPYKF